MLTVLGMARLSRCCWAMRGDRLREGEWADCRSSDKAKEKREKGKRKERRKEKR
jgi:hypothetical protein